MRISTIAVVMFIVLGGLSVITWAPNGEIERLLREG